jgi:uncharacterized paraquat-inducible protein A
MPDHLMRISFADRPDSVWLLSLWVAVMAAETDQRHQSVPACPRCPNNLYSETRSKISPTVAKHLSRVYV